MYLVRKRIVVVWLIVSTIVRAPFAFRLSESYFRGGNVFLGLLASSHWVLLFVAGVLLLTRRPSTAMYKRAGRGPLPNKTLSLAGHTESRRTG